MGVAVIMFVVMAIVVMVMIFVMIMMMVVMFVFMVMIVVVVRDLLLAVDADGEVRRRDAATGDGFADKFDAGNAEGVKLGQRGIRVGLEFQKCGREHVARGAH